MKTNLRALLVLPVALCFSNCTLDENGNIPGTEGMTLGGSPSGSYGQPLTAVSGPGKVTIMEGSRTVATCYTASPNVEQTRWYSEQEQIVVKSRGNHGPATVQLFNSRTGRQEGTVMAYELAAGGPNWAAGMAD